LKKIKFEYYDLEGENKSIQKKLKQNWSLRRIYRYLKKSFPYHTDAQINDSISFNVNNLGLKFTKRQYYGLKKQIEELQGDQN